jgi:hypothetical protein
MPELLGYVDGIIPQCRPQAGLGAAQRAGRHSLADWLDSRSVSGSLRDLDRPLLPDLA